MNENPSDTADMRDIRTGQGDHIGPSMNSGAASETPDGREPQNRANASNSGARSSEYSMDDIEEDEESSEDDMGHLIDPSLGRERVSTNPDVMDLDSSWLEESEEPDFSDDPGTSDLTAVIQEGETYFAPIDPPMRPGENQHARTVSDFAGSSPEMPNEPEEHPLRLQINDDELAEQVMYALSADSYTADLNIEVEVVDGVVYLHGKVGSLDDIEQAEQLAGSVPGVEDVEEDLEIV